MFYKDYLPVIIHDDLRALSERIVTEIDLQVNSRSIWELLSKFSLNIIKYRWYITVFRDSY